jgi:excisionase family DNA binding protein
MPELGIYCIEEVAELLKIPISGVRELIRKGELKACRFSERRTRIDEYDLLQFIKKSKQHHQHDPVRERIVARDCDCP